MREKNIMKFVIKFVLIILINIYIVSSILTCFYINFMLLAFGHVDIDVSNLSFIYAINLFFLFLGIFLAIFEAFAYICFKLRVEIQKKNISVIKVGK